MEFSAFDDDKSTPVPLRRKKMMLDSTPSVSESDPSKCILIIYTGGTMGMTRGADSSLRPNTEFLQEQLGMITEFQQEIVPPCSIMQMPRILDSSNMEPKDWTEMASVVNRYYTNFRGFVFIHGTDTLAYSASALSYMLENLGKPVIFTGSQLPLTIAHSDAKRNLIHACMFAAMDIYEVCICFNNQIFRGNRSVKKDSRSFDGFWSPNFPPLADIGASIKVRYDRLLHPPQDCLKAHLKPMTARIAVVYVTPGFNFSFMRHMNDFSAIVFALYGSGNAPYQKEGFSDAVRELSNCVLVACSQCSIGSVNLDTYEVGMAVKNAGIISVSDMTIEATVSKLYYLFTRYKMKRDVEMAMTANLRGEISITHPSTLSFENLQQSLTSDEARISRG